MNKNKSAKICAICGTKFTPADPADYRRKKQNTQHFIKTIML